MYNNLKSQAVSFQNNVLRYIAYICFYLNDTKFTIPLDEVMVKD